MTGNRLFGIILALLIVGSLAAGWFAGISPIVNQIASANANTREVELTNQAHQAQLDLLKAQYEEMPELTKELAELRKSMPGSVRGDDFADELQAIATATGVTISSLSLGEAVGYGLNADGTSNSAAPVAEAEVDPEAESTEPATDTPVDTTVPDPAAPPSLAPGAELDGKLFTVPVTGTVSGPGPSVSAFLMLVQKSPRLMLLTGFQVSGVASATVEGSFTGHIFVVQDLAADALEFEFDGGESETGETEPTEPTPTETPEPSPTETPAP